MSGQTASVRYQFRGSNGFALAGGTLLIASLDTRTVTSEGLVAFFAGPQLPTGVFFGGALEILSTQSAVFCSAWLVDASGVASVGPASTDLHMVRFNPHPRTVE